MNKLPKSQQPKAKVALQEIWMAATRQEAERAFDQFLTLYIRELRSVWKKIGVTVGLL